METDPDIYRAIDFSGLQFVTVFLLYLKSMVNLKYVLLEINGALQCSVCYNIFVMAKINDQFKKLVCVTRDKWLLKCYVNER